MQGNKNFMILVVVVVLVLALVVFFSMKKNPEENMVNDTPIGEGGVLQKDGVKISVLQDGTGEVAKEGDMVSVNYTGKFTDGRVFDSNVDPSFNHPTPLSFPIGSENIIKGWSVGIEGMKVGEKRLLEISPEMAYGAMGVPGVIPPDSTLIFEVELLSIN